MTPDGKPFDYRAKVRDWSKATPDSLVETFAVKHPEMRDDPEFKKSVAKALAEAKAKGKSKISFTHPPRQWADEVRKEPDPKAEKPAEKLDPLRAEPGDAKVKV